MVLICYVRYVLTYITITSRQDVTANRCQLKKWPLYI